MQNTKYSRQRETLLNVIKKTKCHPDADWIYTQARIEIPNISLGTVYRNLTKLVTDGKIITIDVGDGRDHYDGTVEPHLHLICTECGQIVDLDGKFPDEAIRETEKCTGAKITGYSLVFRGVCKECNR